MSLSLLSLGPLWDSVHSDLSLVHMCSLTDLELDLSLALSARQLLFGMIAVGKNGCMTFHMFNY